MEITFFIITVVFLVFLIISYYLSVLRLSSPLVFIYILYILSSMINDDYKNDEISEVSIFDEKEKTTAIATTKSVNIDSNEKLKPNISKPVVSFNPKPIIIDSNLIISKDKDKEIVIESSTTDKETKSVETIEPKNITNFLKLNEIMICRGVYKRNPIKPGFTFLNNVDSLFCYTKISNNGPKQEIKHVWYFNDKLITSVIYNIKTSYNYRSWSKKTILPKQVGNWRVDIVDASDVIIGSREFEIQSLNDAY